MEQFLANMYDGINVLYTNIGIALITTVVLMRVHKKKRGFDSKMDIALSVFSTFVLACLAAILTLIACIEIGNLLGVEIYQNTSKPTQRYEAIAAFITTIVTLSLCPHFVNIFKRIFLNERSEEAKS